MLFSNQLDWFNQSYVIVLVVLAVYTPNALTHNDQIVQNTIDQPNQNASREKLPYEEFYIEHNVSQGDAKQSFFNVGVKLLDGAYSLKSAID